MDEKKQPKEYVAVEGKVNVSMDKLLSGDDSLEISYPYGSGKANVHAGIDDLISVDAFRTTLKIVGNGELRNDGALPQSEPYKGREGIFVGTTFRAYNSTLELEGLDFSQRPIKNSIKISVGKDRGSGRKSFVKVTHLRTNQLTLEAKTGEVKIDGMTSIDDD